MLDARSTTSLRAGFIRRGALCLAVLTSGGSLAVAEAQGLPFAVTIIDWQRDTRETQRRAYRSEAEDHEVLFCVESWSTTRLDNGSERITIHSVRREKSGRRDRITNVQESCLGEDGTPRPMFHTHSDGNCQFSPSDLITVIARNAPFEGVQCGEQHFVWQFASQLVKLVTVIETERLRRMVAPPE